MNKGTGSEKSSIVEFEQIAILRCGLFFAIFCSLFSILLMILKILLFRVVADEITRVVL